MGRLMPGHVGPHGGFLLDLQWSEPHGGRGCDEFVLAPAGGRDALACICIGLHGHQLCVGWEVGERLWCVRSGAGGWAGLPAPRTCQEQALGLYL